MADKKYGDGRRRNKKTAEDAHVKRVPSILWVFVILLLMAGSALGIAFTVGEHYYRTHFMEGTTVNGIDVSNRTAEDVKARFQNEIGDYQLVIHERTSDGGSVEETITGGEIGLEKVFDNALREGLESQLRGNWLLERGEPHDLELGSMVQYDSAAWKMKVDQLQ